MRRSFRDHFWLKMIAAATLCTCAALADTHVLGASRRSPPDEALARRFFKEYPSAAARLKQATNNLRCEARFVFVNEYEADMTFLIKGDSAQIVYRYDKEKRLPNYPDVTVYSFTPDFIFKLAQPVEGGPFVVRGFADGEEATHQQKKARAVRRTKMDLFVNAAFEIFGGSIASLVSHPTFRVTGIASSSQAGREVVAVDFVAEPEDDESFWFGSGSGRMVFVPSLNWALTEYRVIGTSKNGNSIAESAEIEYPDSANMAFVFPDRVKWTRHFQERRGQGNGNAIAFVMDFHEAQPGVVTDDQFTLAAFNLPDISSDGAASNYPFDNWLFWLLLAVAVTCGVVLWRLRSGRSAEVNS